MLIQWNISHEREIPGREDQHTYVWLTFIITYWNVHLEYWVHIQYVSLENILVTKHLNIWWPLTLADNYLHSYDWLEV